ncbi:ATP-binding protein [Actinoallomurus spadix]|uniref:Histidine kinase/HSP90-like ATPase domain-containing protein n=1 Tax=Actinoallomurus spadix TaxID=79912 RepID=A0ABP3G050_9ACTN|nr:ATP-binding protein [Actinoallomurus spadix]MCO5988646.1 ATP-binding protein [Actinoallomurus spadix]
MTPDPAVITDRSPYPPEPASASVSLHVRRDAVRDARRFAAGAVAGHPYDSYEIALVASELATNAVRAAETMHPTWPDDIRPIGITLTVTDRYAHLAVSDPDPEPLPAQQHGGLLAERGRGLTIVDQHAAARWVTYTDRHKTVHALITAPGVILTATELAEIQEAS